MAMHVNGPVLNKVVIPAGQGLRGWYQNLPVRTDPDYTFLTNDFLKANDYNTTDFTLSGTGTPTSAVGTTTNTNGLVTLTTTNSSADSSQIQLKQDSWKLDASGDGKRLWFEAAASFSNVATCDAFIGLSEIQSDVITSSQNYVGFRMTTGSAAISYQTCLANTQTTAASGVVHVAATQMKFGFLFSGGNHVDFFINRSYVGTITTNLPTAAMTPAFEIITNSANARTLVLDYFDVVKER